MASDSPVASKLSCHATDTSIAPTTLFARTSARTNIDSLFVLSTDMYKQYDVQDSRVLNLHNHKLTVQHPSLNFGSAGSFSHPFFVRVSFSSSFSLLHLLLQPMQHLQVSTEASPASVLVSPLALAPSDA